MAWTILSYPYGSILTSAKMTQLFDNIAAQANGDVGSPQQQTAGIADLGVTTAKIADLNVTNGKLGDSSVTTTKIYDLHVTDAKLATSSVVTTKIADLNVTNAKLGAISVTTDKIYDLHITNAKLGGNSVTTGKIMDGNVVNADLGNSSVSRLRISTNIASLAGNVVAGSYIDITLWPYSFFPMFHSTTNDTVMGGHSTDGASADLPRCSMKNVGVISDSYDFDYRYIQTP